MVVQLTRSRRFALRLPVWYRILGDSEWHLGVTINLSTAGAVIEGALPRSAAGTVVVVISFPAAAGCLAARGRVVRDETTAADGLGRFTITVPRYHVERRSRVSPCVDALLQGC